MRTRGATLLAIGVSWMFYVCGVEYGVVTMAGEQRPTRCTKDCEITQSKVVTLIDPASRWLPDYSIHVWPHPSGNFVASSTIRQVIVVFGPDGTVKQTLGGNVPGKGTFRQLTNLVPGRNGNLLAFDPVKQIVVSIDKNLRLSSPSPLSYKPSFQLADGSFVIARPVPTTESAGFPIHVASSEGKILRSFGLAVPQMRQDLRLVLERIVAPSAKGGVWAIAPGRFIIDRWDLSKGVQVETLQARSTWFREGPRVQDERVRPNSIIEAIWEDDGLIWILGRDADSNWAAPKKANIERPFEINEYNGRFDWVIEVLDPGTATVVASKRFDKALWAGSLSPLVVTQQTASQAGARFDVWKLGISQREKRQ